MSTLKCPDWYYEWVEIEFDEIKNEPLIRLKEGAPKKVQKEFEEYLERRKELA